MVQSRALGHTGFSSCRAWLGSCGRTSFGVLRHVECFQTRGNCVPCIGRQTPNRWTTRELLPPFYLLKILYALLPPLPYSDPAAYLAPFPHFFLHIYTHPWFPATDLPPPTCKDFAKPQARSFQISPLLRACCGSPVLWSCDLQGLPWPAALFNSIACPPPLPLTLATSPSNNTATACLSPVPHACLRT